MSNSQNEQQQLYLALYLLKKKFNTPYDLIKFWAFAGPCIETHPQIEDYVEKI